MDLGLNQSTWNRVANALKLYNADKHSHDWTMKGKKTSSITPYDCSLFLSMLDSIYKSESTHFCGMFEIYKRDIQKIVTAIIKSSAVPAKVGYATFYPELLDAYNRPPSAKRDAKLSTIKEEKTTRRPASSALAPIKEKNPLKDQLCAALPAGRQHQHDAS
jgi:hypothetical protein